MANFGSYLTLASYSRLRKQHYEDNKDKSVGGKCKEVALPDTDDSVKFAATLQIFFSICLTFYVWLVFFFSGVYYIEKVLRRHQGNTYYVWKSRSMHAFREVLHLRTTNCGPRRTNHKLNNHKYYHHFL